MQTTYDRLAALRSTVRECLAALDGAAPTEPEVGRAFDRLAEGFTELGDLGELVRRAPAAERGRMEEELSGLGRLHAVLTSAVAKDRERLGCLLDQARTSRNALRGASAAEQPRVGLDRSA